MCSVLLHIFVLLLQALKLLRTAEHAPYIVFIAAPRPELLRERELTNINVSC